MNTEKKLVFATNNNHKLQEARQIIGDAFSIVSLSEIGCHDDIPETADTLEGNALMKARWVKERYGYDCFADDTGLMVDALGGAPGVLSARYAGPGHDSAANMKKLLSEMDGQENRKAHFSTAIALLADGEEHIFEGRVEGSISDHPSGKEGFGYDPVFVADESGRSFAEMTADEKNAISHRGRAMRKLRDFLLYGITMLFLLLLPALGGRAESWRHHPSYSGFQPRIIDTPKHTYFLCEAEVYVMTNKAVNLHNLYIFRYDKEADEFRAVNDGGLLKANVARAAEYDFEKRRLVVAFPDGSISLLDDNGDSTIIPALQLTGADINKEINAITIQPDSNEILLSTNFGYVVVDKEKKEISTSRNFHSKIMDTARFNGKTYVATENQLYVGPNSAKSFGEMELLSDFPHPRRLVPVGNRLFVNHLNSGMNWIVMLEPDGDNYRATQMSNQPETGLEVAPYGLLINGRGRLRKLDASKNFEETSVYLKDPDLRMVAGTSDFSNVWFSHDKKGFTLKKAPADPYGDWTVIKDEFLPNVSSVFISTAMLHTSDLGMLVNNHGIDSNFTPDYYEQSDLLCALKDLEWTPLAPAYTAPDAGFIHYLPDGIARDPRNPSHIYTGSAQNGLLRIDLDNPEKSLHFSHTSDADHNNPRFVKVVDDDPTNTFYHYAVLNSPAFDAAGNLWMIHMDPVKRNLGELYYELWAWTPEARQATRDPQSFKPFVKLPVRNSEVNRLMRCIPLLYSSHRNIVVAYGGATNSEIAIYDHNGTLSNTADDKLTRISKARDQDGQELELGTVNCFFEDPSGLLWVGANNGLFTINIDEALADGQTIRRIKVSRNDGTGLADYLLNNTRVNSIARDGAGDMWFATTGGGLVRTSSDGRVVKKTYTPSNSELPHLTVHGLGYNPDTNSMMVSTAGGLCEIYIDGAGNSDSDYSARVYPNPVRPGFSGYVVIDSLPEDAYVKITDASGTVRKVLDQAIAGETRWDVTDMSHNRVPAGVYFVIATSGPDSSDFSKVQKILVVN
ncbi:MAG: non-canonical purine NTP diphosphatase [Bacteroidales bacterium]|nr:non-canonical purine NTP diphosphatase [Bacteroidales bacterium]